jgi:tRNA(Ile)-lysidine synthase
MAIDSKFLDRLDAGLTLASVPNGATLVVAFSGGPDSTALLAGLAYLGKQRELTLIAAHVNHQIQTESSDRDQLAASLIAESIGIAFKVETVDAPALAAEHKISIELAARHARYAALSKFASTNSAHGVVTGHTRNDQAETVLLHASRGAGLKGIGGMSYSSILRFPESNLELNVLRPMLDTPRSECIDYCEQLGITPVVDPSNSSREYTRNQIRLDVLPLLEQGAPGSSDALARLAKNATDDLEIIDWVVERFLNEARTETGAYSRLAITELPRSLIARMLMRAYETHVGHSRDLERVHVSEMVSQLLGRSGTSIELPNRTHFYVDKESFGFALPDHDDCPYPSSLSAMDFQLPGTTLLGDGFSANAEIVDRPDELDSGSPHITYATPGLLSHSLTLRNRVNGDRFQPLGMKQRVKLQDFFVGAGVPERWRDRVPIIESDEGIVWVAGYRLAEWAKVLPNHTRVAKLEITGSDDNRAH